MNLNEEIVRLQQKQQRRRTYWSKVSQNVRRRAQSRWRLFWSNSIIWTDHLAMFGSVFICDHFRWYPLTKRWREREWENVAAGRFGSIFTVLKDFHRVSIPRPTFELPSLALGENSDNTFVPKEKKSLPAKWEEKSLSLPILLTQSTWLVCDSIMNTSIRFFPMNQNLSVTFGSTGFSFFHRDVSKTPPFDEWFSLFVVTHFKSSSNSLQLNRLINEVRAAGIMMIGVFDGRLLESPAAAKLLSALDGKGFGVERLAVGVWRRRREDSFPARETFDFYRKFVRRRAVRDVFQRETVIGRVRIDAKFGLVSGHEFLLMVTRITFDLRPGCRLKTIENVEKRTSRRVHRPLGRANVARPSPLVSVPFLLSLWSNSRSTKCFLRNSKTGKWNSSRLVSARLDLVAALQNGRSISPRSFAFHDFERIGGDRCWFAARLRRLFVLRKIHNSVTGRGANFRSQFQNRLGRQLSGQRPNLIRGQIFVFLVEFPFTPVFQPLHVIVFHSSDFRRVHSRIFGRTLFD